MSKQFTNIMPFCEELEIKANLIGEIRFEMNEAIETYAKENSLTKKSVKKMYAYFKELRKDRTEAEIVERERELLIEAMLITESAQ